MWSITGLGVTRSLMLIVTWHDPQWSNYPGKTLELRNKEI